MYHNTLTSILDNRIKQGDIFCKVPYFESYIVNNSGDFEINIKEFPLSLVITQDCDLEQNLKNRNSIQTKPDNDNILSYDKFLVSVIVLPLYNAQHLFEGTHLSELKIKTENFNSDRRKIIKQNNNSRYHYIELPKDNLLPALIIDFKHMFSINLNWLESNKANRVCSIDELYREYISQRFSNFLSRIGLPDAPVN